MITENYKENILIGSILGDGTLSKYGRSKNALYREHGTILQNEYRKWKAENLGLKFNPQRGKIWSKSLPQYTYYYYLFYRNGKKELTQDILDRLNHPIGLMCLYFDDGSLVIDKYKRKDGYHLFPRVYLYTQSFTYKENLLLRDHLYKQFNIDFLIKKISNGSGYCLNLNKRKDIVRMMSLIRPFAKDIPCMHYKINLLQRLYDYQKKYPNSIIDTLDIKNNSYSSEEINYIKSALTQNITQREIANNLDRTYYSVVDKIRRMKKRC